MVKIIHADHQLSPAQLEFVKAYAEENGNEGFFILETEMPAELGPVKNALWGPASGDAPVEEDDVFYRQRSADRPYKDRLVRRPARDTQQIQIIGAGDRVFTAYGGPLAPQHPDDPTNSDPEASRKFWAEHALCCLTKEIGVTDKNGNHGVELVWDDDEN